jgi:hypothetical protein
MQLVTVRAVRCPVSFREETGSHFISIPLGITIAVDPLRTPLYPRIETFQVLLMMNCRSNCAIFLAVICCVLTFSAVSIAQSIADPNIRISQIYTRGGGAGATFQNDFVELFNRGQTSVDISGWSLNISNFSGGPPNIQISATNIKLFPTTSMIMSPGSHFLIKFGGSGSNGLPFTSDINLNPFPISDTGGQIVLLAKDKTLPFGFCPAAPDLTGVVVDYVGYGIAILRRHGRSRAASG